MSKQSAPALTTSMNIDPSAGWSRKIPVTLRYLPGIDEPVPRKTISASPSFIAFRWWRVA